MRDVKFRGKDIKTNRWVYGGYFKHLKRTSCPIGDFVKEEDYEYLILSSGFSDWNMPKPIECYVVDGKTVGQYTGLKDKYGKEICEGDVVSFKYGTDIIKYNGYAFDIGDCWSLQELRYTVEVIGNKFDNPELINS